MFPEGLPFAHHTLELFGNCCVVNSHLRTRLFRNLDTLAFLNKQSFINVPANTAVGLPVDDSGVWQPLLAMRSFERRPALPLEDCGKPSSNRT